MKSQCWPLQRWVGVGELGEACWCVCGFVLIPVMVTTRPHLSHLCTFTLSLGLAIECTCRSGETTSASPVPRAVGSVLWEGEGRHSGPMAFCFCLALAAPYSGRTSMLHLCPGHWVQTWCIPTTPSGMLTSLGLCSSGCRECRQPPDPPSPDACICGTGSCSSPFRLLLLPRTPSDVSMCRPLSVY